MDETPKSLWAMVVGTPETPIPQLDNMEALLAQLDLQVAPDPRAAAYRCRTPQEELAGYIAALKDQVNHNAARVFAEQTRANHLQLQLDAANADLKVLRDLLKGARWFATCPETGTDCYTREEDAHKIAADCLADCRDDAGDGWPDEIEGLCAGILIPLWKVAQIYYEDTPGGQFDYRCDYELQPVRDIDRIRQAAELSTPTQSDRENT